MWTASRLSKMRKSGPDHYGTGAPEPHITIGCVRASPELFDLAAAYEGVDP